MNVEVVDFGDPTAPSQFARSLVNTGFAVLVNHPLSWDLIEELFTEWNDFFDSKARLAYRPRPGSQAGYFGPDVSETAKGYDVRDLKEFFHIYPDEVYPSEVSDAALRYRREAEALATTLLEWVEANTPEEVAANYSRPLSTMLNDSKRTLLRILRYPPLSGTEAQGAVRAAAHEDINLLTVLPSSNEPGLELADRHGGWHPVPCDPESLAVNCGEMLQHASAGHFPATTHRVVNPTGNASRRHRMAAPLFLHPSDDVILAHGRTARSFLDERLSELRSLDHT